MKIILIDKHRLLISLYLVIGFTLLLTGPFSVFASQVLTEPAYCHDSHAHKEGQLAAIDTEKPCQDAVTIPTKTTVVLPDDAVEKLTIKAGFGWGIFNGSIYNGNHNYLVTRLIINMTPIHDHHMEMMESAAHETKQYAIDLNLPPLSKGALSLAIDSDESHVHDFDWEIIQVLGQQISR